VADIRHARGRCLLAWWNARRLLWAGSTCLLWKGGRGRKVPVHLRLSEHAAVWSKKQLPLWWRCRKRACSLLPAHAAVTPLLLSCT